MRRKRIVWAAGVAIAVVLFGGLNGWAQSTSGSNAPVISHAFTVDKIKYGDILRVYIEAEDPQGQMMKIATVVHQAGAGRYPTSWVYLKSSEDRKHFKGYLQWNTYSSRTPYVSEWTPITLTVSVLDKSGNESNAFVFPITLESGVRRASSYPLPTPFNQGDVKKLGTIDVELMDFTILRGSE